MGSKPLIAAAAALVAAGCTGGPANDCGVCATGEICIDGSCVRVCAEHEDCPDGLGCFDDVCGEWPEDGRPNGAPCDVTEDCLGGRCDEGLCCAGLECCRSADDCPAAYDQGAVCNQGGTATDCQGTRFTAACIDNACSSQPTADDSGCAGLARSCPDNLRAVACTSDVDQPVAECRTDCTTVLHCVGGTVCVEGECHPPVGAGEACTGSGQGTCLAGLQCVNDLCCATGGPACCDADADCPGNLACNDSAFACQADCIPGDDAACADPAATYCTDGSACAPKAANGAACSDDFACVSGICVCADAGCTARRCAAADCDACGFSSDGSACDGTLDPSIVCDDGNSCTEDRCLAPGGCTNPTIANRVGFDGATGHCLMFFNTGRTWTAAAAACAALSPPGYLAIVSTPLEAQVLRDQNVVGQNAFAGCTDGEGLAPGAAEGVWRWTSGETCDNDDPGYAQESWTPDLGPWNTGEPNNGDGGEDCMVITSASRDWDDRKCEDPYAYLCERDQ